MNEGATPFCFCHGKQMKSRVLTIQPPDGSERYEAGRGAHASVGIAALHVADKSVPSDFSN
jgi:hypothetical protein